MPVEFLDREKPTPFKLLGMDIVVWNDGEVVSEDTGLPIGFGSKVSLLHTMLYRGYIFSNAILLLLIVPISRQTDRPKNAVRTDGTWRAFIDRCVS